MVPVAVVLVEKDAAGADTTMTGVDVEVIWVVGLLVVAATAASAAVTIPIATKLVDVRCSVIFTTAGFRSGVLVCLDLGNLYHLALKLFVTIRVNGTVRSRLV